MSSFKPMKGVSVEITDLAFPVLVSRKLDGLRGVVIEGELRFASCKAVPNKATSAFFSHPALTGLDGELIVGAPNAKDVFIRSTGALRKVAFDPKAVFYVFDLVPQLLGMSDPGFAGRHVSLTQHVARIVAQYPQFAGRIVVLEQLLVADADTLTGIEADALAAGYEGLMVRSVNGPYKMGRATASSGWLGKIKRFRDAEAQLLAVVEGVGNCAGTAGALRVRDLATCAEFEIGTGFDFATRAQWWAERNAVRGRIIKYKFFPIGYESSPRHPVYIGERLAQDMS